MDLEKYLLHLQKRRKKKTKTKTAKKQTHNLLLSIVAFVCESYLFCASCKCQFMESRNQQQYAYC